MAEPVADIPAPPDAPAEPKRPRGRPRKDAAKAPVKSPKTTLPVKADYTADVQGLVTSVWTVTAMLPPTQPVAYVISANADPLVAALAEGAKHNEFIRSMVDGPAQNAWALQLAAVAANMGLTAVQIMRDPELKAKSAEATREQLKALAGAQADALKDEEPSDNPAPSV